MRLSHLFIIATASALIATTASAGSSAINVQFSRDQGAQQTGGAVIGGPGDAWNDMFGNAGSGALVDASGTATGVNLSFSAALVYESQLSFTRFTGTPVANLMQGYLVDFMDSPGIDLRFSGLAANQIYGFWIYTQGDDNSAGRQISLAANGADPVFATQTNAGSLTLGDNYVYIVSRADAQGVVDIVGHDLNGEADINGVQLIAVPEPATAPLLAAGLLVVAGAAVRRRRSR
ncbi:MAG: PEP-CTERM sorting domain-containing protein [Burkholderiales bacterium]|jgi:hypothetical protein|nr:PEP-CTERM sorting domain-containing protein [Burkholderiales bacterium]